MDCTQSPLAQQALPRLCHATTQDVTVIGAGPAGALLAYLLAVRSAHLAAAALLEASAHDTSPQAYEVAVDANIMPELSGAHVLQQLFDAYPGFFHLLLRSRSRYWRALAKVLRGERGFADVDRVLRRHPYLVRGALWLRAHRQGIVVTAVSMK
jgi:flavin-dependent dehydrogenase